MSSTAKFTAWLTSPGKTEFDRAAELRKAVDPEKTPFKSKYEAIEIYQKLVKDLEALQESEPCDRLWLALLVLQTESASTHVDTEDLASAERSLQQSIELVRSRLKIQFLVQKFNSNDEASGEVKVFDADSKELPTELSAIWIQLYNQLGFLKSVKLNFDGAVPFLKEAERLYYVWYVFS